MADPRYRDWRKPLLELLLEHSVRRGEFTLASGETSSIYVDVRSTALLGEGALLIGHAFWELIGRHCGEAAAVGGLTLGADPLVTATAMAAHMDAERSLAAVIVRKEPKGHGTGQWIEKPDTLNRGDVIVAVDDVITTGGSTILAIEKMREAGFEVTDALCVVDREAGGRRALAEQDVTLHALFTLSDLVAASDPD